MGGWHWFFKSKLWSLNVEIECQESCGLILERVCMGLGKCGILCNEGINLLGLLFFNNFGNEGSNTKLRF